jgi:serine/threonine-protein kinase
MVLAATDLRLRRQVAIKVLRAELSDDPEIVSRFLREARAASRLSSEHAVGVHEVGELADGTPYIVMEHLSGHDLTSYVEGAGRAPTARAVGWILQTLEALAEAHAIGIVHRDLKPGNLFLTRRADSTELVKVLDFGLAKAPAPLTDGAPTDASLVFGSPQYMSPEQLRGAGAVDRRADIWALGVTLYELLTGRLPFEAANVADVTTMILRDPPTSPRAHRPDLSPELADVVLRCLEKDPSLRWSNVAELAAALEPHGPPEARGAAERVWRVVFVSSATVPTSSGEMQAAAPVAASLPLIRPAAVREAPARGPTTVLAEPPGRARRLALALGAVSVVAGAALFFVVVGPPAPRTVATTSSTRVAPEPVPPSAPTSAPQSSEPPPEPSAPDSAAPPTEPSRAPPHPASGPRQAPPRPSATAPRPAQVY